MAEILAGQDKGYFFVVFRLDCDIDDSVDFCI